MFAAESAPTSSPEIQAAVQGLGDRVLNEEALSRHIWPLFSRVLSAAAPAEIYLANHSLGRPVDQTQLDVQQAMDAWYESLNGAWEVWLLQRDYFRGQVASLINAASGDCILPRANAGQGLRAVLNGFDHKVQVLTSGSEFDSIDFILKVYAQRGRVELTSLEADQRGRYEMGQLLGGINDRTDLVVISLVMFLTGQWLSELPELIEKAHEHGALVLVDLYHAVGALPVDIQSLDADFAVGGCYKYLRGGPGAGWLYLHPRHLDGHFRSLDCGWYAQSDPFAFKRPALPEFASGGNAFLESTPAVLPFYQAKAGLEFTSAIGVERLRAYSLQQQELLTGLLHDQGIKVFDSPANCGAFVAIADLNAQDTAGRLLRAGIRVDAREGYLRVCPDLLNTTDDLRAVVHHLREIYHTRR